ncbi:hypothetical protein J2T55_000479 [Methylohalomonas lacus]|uniref:Uncharacterized protein n=1 Tax=Methylohalomonas lacus TaxID=398773 RepID=A0AAE3HHK1_9GAMM|nr:hypothetical protein [Methylohalomonas lacus]MCS3902475.1 hypothetical protein [Methylohalomonas lacus]
MVFDYYNRLSKRNQAVYRQSDALTEVKLANPEALRPGIPLLQQALENEDRAAVELACRGFCAGFCADIKVTPVRVRVLAVRPHNDYAELHGLYEPAEGRGRARISLWMRTARHRRVVAFRTFLRTLLHEYCHHLDYEHYGLAESFHTEGFFKRESSLFKQLVE